jgi:nicotinic acid mononucleotide adenylyltransferase
MRKLKEENKDYYFKFIIGSDLLKDLPKWAQGDELVKENDFIVIKRKGYDIME